MEESGSEILIVSRLNNRSILHPWVIMDNTWSSRIVFAEQVEFMVNPINVSFNIIFSYKPAAPNRSSVTMVTQVTAFICLSCLL